MKVHTSIQRRVIIWSTWLYLFALLVVLFVLVVLQDGVVVVGPIPTCYAFHADHFTFRTAPQQQKKMWGLLQSSHNNDQDSSSPSSKPSLTTKLESKTIERFTTGYNKLCKTCPTRLQPRVDTLVEMILGLSEDERDELLTTVEQRLQDGNLSTISSSQDVYNFQTKGGGGDVTSNKKEQQKQLEEEEETSLPFAQPSSSSSITTTTTTKSHPIIVVDQEDEEEDVLEEESPMTTSTKENRKLQDKMEKTKKKYEYSKEGIAKTKRLLEATTALLSSSSSTTLNLDEDYYDTNYYHEIDLLKQMTRDELKMEHLKLLAQKAKYEQQVAKLRMKRYKASIKYI